MRAQPPFHCEYMSDLYCLWAWSETLQEFPDKHWFSESDSILLKPNRGCRSAFMRYGTKYQAVCDEIKASEAELQRLRLKWLESPSEDAKTAATDAIYGLADRIQAGCRIISDGESSEQIMTDRLEDALLLGDVDFATRQPPTGVESSNEDRDKWIYERKKAADTHGQIRARLRNEHPEWEQLDSDQAVGKAAQRYATRHGLPQIIRKQ